MEAVSRKENSRPSQPVFDVGEINSERIKAYKVSAHKADTCTFNGVGDHRVVDVWNEKKVRDIDR